MYATGVSSEYGIWEELKIQIFISLYGPVPTNAVIPVISLSNFK